MRSSLARLLAAAAVCAAAPSLATAQSVLASSTFDTGLEGWGRADFYSLTLTYSAPTWNAAGGNPGGFISTNDPDANWIAFLAPSAYLGDQSAAIGGEMRFDLRRDGGTLNNGPLLHVRGGGVSLFFTRDAVPETSWTSFVVPIGISALWRVGSEAGAQATLADFQTVFGNLTGIRVMADITSGADDTGLDNVSLVSAPPTSVVPEPSTWALLGTGLVGLGVTTARRRRA